MRGRIGIFTVVIIAAAIAYWFLSPDPRTLNRRKPEAKVTGPERTDEARTNNDAIRAASARPPGAGEQDDDEREEAELERDTRNLERFPPAADESAAAVPASPSVLAVNSSPTITAAADHLAGRPGDPPFLTADDLRRLEESGATVSGLIGGIARGRRSVSSVDVPPESAEEAAADNREPAPLLTGQIRGYTMYYLMHPAARQTVEAQVQAMLESRVQDLYVGVLTDGTFGKDFDYLADVLTRLSSDGRAVVLALYLVNGPNMRRVKSNSAAAPLSDIEPKLFRELIRSNSDVRGRFTAAVREVQPILEYNLRLSPNNRNIIAVMLEDNLDAESYGAMRAMAAGVVGSMVHFVRSPCANCYAGNDEDGLGDPLELHDPRKVGSLSAAVGLTLDGDGYYFDGESGTRNLLTLKSVRELERITMARGFAYFGLWRFERQGLTVDHPSPDERIYEVPSPGQLEAEVSLLAEGLTPLATPTPTE
jgi:hypothetical protein